MTARPSFRPADGREPPDVLGPEAWPAVPAPRLARTIIVAVLVGYALMTVLNLLWQEPSGPRLATGLLCVAAVFALQYAHCSQWARHWATRRKAVTLTVQAAFTYLPFLWFGGAWGSMAGPLAGSFLLMLAGRTAWALYGASVAAILAFAVVHEGNWNSVAYLTIASALTGLVIFGVTRLADLVQEIHSTRSELARMAVGQERLRFARDLHDLLGYSLSAITLKTELVHRLIAAHPQRARDEVASVLEVSRQALADVRLVASGYRDMSLADEAASAAQIMSATDVHAEVDVACGPLHHTVDTALATALREGVTNILRHSKVQTCSVTAAVEGETVRLVLVNDGVTAPTPVRTAHSGSGLGNLQSRLAAIGGRISAGVREDGRFELLAEAPTAPTVGAPPSARLERSGT
ncbi:sensor histidine kinase [Streptomyces sparsus]